jgi:hypothetical protein
MLQRAQAIAELLSRSSSAWATRTVLHVAYTMQNATGSTHRAACGKPPSVRMHHAEPRFFAQC